MVFQYQSKGTNTWWIGYLQKTSLALDGSIKGMRRHWDESQGMVLHILLADYLFFRTPGTAPFSFGLNYPN